MNRLSNKRRAQVLNALTEGCGIRSTARLVGVGRGTVLRLLAEAGKFADMYQAYRFYDLPCQRVECDEIWSYTGARQKNATRPGQGDCYTFTSIDPDSKLMIAWVVGDRSEKNAVRLLQLVADRVGSQRVEINTDGYPPYVTAVRKAFGHRVDFAQLVKVYNPDDPPGKQKRRVIGDPNMDRLATSIIERSNLHLRHRVKRFGRKSMGYSKVRTNHHHAVALHALVSNFCTPHGTLTRRAKGQRTTPAMAVGLENRPWTLLDVTRRMDVTVEIGAP